ncbi:hypothetical protein HK101_006753, partial [Irineochytrium annulatum]
MNRFFHAFSRSDGAPPRNSTVTPASKCGIPSSPRKEQFHNVHDNDADTLISFAPFDDAALIMAMRGRREHWASHLQKADSAISLKPIDNVIKRKPVDVIEKAINKGIKSVAKIIRTERAYRNTVIHHKIAQTNAATETPCALVTTPAEVPAPKRQVHFAPTSVMAYFKRDDAPNTLIIPTAASRSANSYADPPYRQPHTLFQFVAAVGEESAQVAVDKLAPTCTQPLLRATVRTARAALEGELASHLREEAFRLLAVARDPDETHATSAGTTPTGCVSIVREEVKTAPSATTTTAGCITDVRITEPPATEMPACLPTTKEIEKKACLRAFVMGW